MKFSVIFVWEMDFSEIKAKNELRNPIGDDILSIRGSLNLII